MTKTNLFAVFVVAAVATMMITAAVAPAYAAQKVVDNTSKTSGSFLAFLCGQPVDAAFKTNSRFVQWDNDKFKFYINTLYKLTDTVTGALVGTVNIISNQQGDSVDLPTSFQGNQKITCVGTGQIDNFHFGGTIHKDGSFTPRS